LIQIKGEAVQLLTTSSPLLGIISLLIGQEAIVTGGGAAGDGIWQRPSSSYFAGARRKCPGHRRDLQWQSELLR